MDDTIFIEIQRLCRLVNERGLRELAISQPDFSISVTSVQAGETIAVQAPAAVAAPVPSVVAPPPAPAAPAGYAVASPLIGIFYRSSSPDTPAFVEVGDQVEVGQTIGIVEAMKVFNEITTDRAGTVIAIPAANSSLVQVDEPLVIIDPLA